MKRKYYITLIFILIFTFSPNLFPLTTIFSKIGKIQEMNHENMLDHSGATVYNYEWLDNNNFSTSDDWFYSKGLTGDNSTVDAFISNEQANYRVVGDTNTFDVLAGTANSSSWVGWGIYNNSDFLLPDNVEINASGLNVYHYLDENESGGAGQVHNFPSVHFRKNISLPNDMSDYEITNASLEVFFNASVESTVDAPGDSVGQSAIFDSATFYVEIADLNLSYAFRVAENKTTDLGQDSPPILSIPDRELTYLNESDLITALNLALEKDPSYSNFTIILGMDIYCEDNAFPDYDEWNALIFKSFNLTFSYERKVDKFSSVSWNQEGNKITGSNVQITDANLKFKYNISRDWPEVLSPYSEIKILINNNPYPETIRLSSANATLQDAKVGGFDVTNLILKNVNISVSIQVFIANTFELGSNITISIDDVYLNITYIETFSDYETRSRLFLNSENKTADPFIELPIGNTLNITIRYLDNQTLNHITNALIELEGKTTGELIENSSFGQYSIIFNSSILDIGLWPLTAIATKNNYVTQSIPFYVNVVERVSEFRVFVDNDEKTNNNTVKIKTNEFMNITVLYKDNSSNQHLSGGNVSISGVGILNELNEQYNLTINSNNLGVGFHVLTINAQLQNYTTHSFQLYVEVFEIATELRFFVNGTQKLENDVVQLDTYEYLNLTIFYLDNNSKTHLSGAGITLLGYGNFSEISNQYNYTLSSLSLNPGFNVISISAQLNNYGTQSIQFYVNVLERESEILLFANNNPLNSSDFIQVELNQFININITFRDNMTKQNLSGALVELIGWGNFSEVNNQYNYTLDTNDLGQGITIVIIQAQLTYFKSQTIQFYIKVDERPSEITLFLNGEDKSSDPVIELPIGSSLNTTIRFTDNITGFYIDNAYVTLEGNDFLLNATENFGLQQYTIELNTTNLDIGVNLLKVTVYKPNYEIKEITLRITVNKISTIVSTETGDPLIIVKPGQRVNLRIVLNDTVFGGLIKGATVTYRWAYGQGNLTDSNNDGIYEGFISDVTIGTYVITITASGNENYDFESFEIILSVTGEGSTAELTWIVYALIGVIVGAVGAFSAYQFHFKYPPMVRKVRKLRKKIKKGKKTKFIMTLERDEIIENNYKDQSSSIGSELKIDANQIKNKIKDKENNK